MRLVAALDALQLLVPAQQSTSEPLREAARQAAKAIPERSSLAFHHAALQDAARATVDAYTLSIPRAIPCSSQDEQTAENGFETADHTQ